MAKTQAKRNGERLYQTAKYEESKNNTATPQQTSPAPHSESAPSSPVGKS